MTMLKLDSQKQLKILSNFIRHLTKGPPNPVLWKRNYQCTPVKTRWCIEQSEFCWFCLLPSRFRLLRGRPKCILYMSGRWIYSPDWIWPYQYSLLSVSPLQNLHRFCCRNVCFNFFLTKILLCLIYALNKGYRGFSEISRLTRVRKMDNRFE